MNSHSKQRSLMAAIALIIFLRSSPAAPAAEYAVAITGEITQVIDDLNWLNDSIQVGMSVAGTYNYFDSGYLREVFIGDPSEVGYRFFFQPDPNFNVPVLPVNMKLAIGAHHYQTADSSFGAYAINVFNDSNGFVAGDAYQVRSPLPFPAHFTDWTGDPVNDADGLFYPYLLMTLNLLDPTGTALTSTDLPLQPPGLLGFASAVGHIYIADGNGEPNYAEVTFRITSLQAVPEPSSLVLWGFASCLAVARVRRMSRLIDKPSTLSASSPDHRAHSNPGTGSYLHRRPTNRLAMAVVASQLSIASAEHASAGAYAIDILITPYHEGFVDSWLFDINDQGQAGGYIVTQPGPFSRKAVIYRHGGVQVLVNEPGTIRAINELGDAIGGDTSAPMFFAANGAATPIEVPGNFVSLNVGSGFPGLNDAGSVLISVFPNDPADAPPNSFSGLALWNLGGSAPLAALDPLYPYVNPPNPEDFASGPSSSSYTASATRLNNANQFAASIHRGDFDPMDPLNEEDDVFADMFADAYVYDGQGNYSLLQSPMPGDEIRPIGIDDSGMVFGWAGNQLALWAPDGAVQSICPSRRLR